MRVPGSGDNSILGLDSGQANSGGRRRPERWTPIDCRWPREKVGARALFLGLAARDGVLSVTACSFFVCRISRDWVTKSSVYLVLFVYSTERFSSVASLDRSDQGVRGKRETS